MLCYTPRPTPSTSLFEYLTGTFVDGDYAALCDLQKIRSMESVSAGLYCAQMPNHRLPPIYGPYALDMTTDISDDDKKGRRVLVELKKL